MVGSSRVARQIADLTCGAKEDLVVAVEYGDVLRGFVYVRICVESL